MRGTQQTALEIQEGTHLQGPLPTAKMLDFILMESNWRALSRGMTWSDLGFKEIKMAAV